jgi:hypothetical protein
VTFESGQFGRCKWSLTRGKPTDADVAGFVAYLRQLTADVATPIVVLDLVHGITLPSAMQRKAITREVAALPKKHLVKAHALVTNSAAARGVLTTINWFVVNRPFAEKVFSAPGPALTWLAEELPDIDARAVLDAIGEQVPSFRKLTW